MTMLRVLRWISWLASLKKLAIFSFFLLILVCLYLLRRLHKIMTCISAMIISCFLTKTYNFLVKIWESITNHNWNLLIRSCLEYIKETSYHTCTTALMYTSVKRPSSWVSTAILVQLKWTIAECKAGAMICKLNVFLKNDLNRLLSLNTGDLDA